MPGESSAVPTEDGVGLNYLETSPPAGPESVQHNPQEPVAPVEAQATRSFGKPQVGGEARGSPPAGPHGFENWRLLKRKGDEKRAHRGSHHDLTNGRNPCVFRSDEVFGKHSFTFDGFRASSRQTLPWDYFRVARDTTKCVSAAQQRVARRRSQLTTADTVADTAICACRMQRHVAEGQCPPTISSWRPICPI
jgi:hypothetical protein